jgi:hypothetical protein
MPFDCQARIFGHHALSVVLDADEPFATQLDRDCDPSSACVVRILDQLLHHRRGAFDDLSGGNLIREVAG